MFSFFQLLFPGLLFFLEFATKKAKLFYLDEKPLLELLVTEASYECVCVSVLMLCDTKKIRRKKNDSISLDGH